ncbi:MAG: VIT1/CCC1 transporter family protein [Thiobacillus sp.]|nr:VIT1/CCC1 transporter family protein [Thiobacillus sp.]
MSDPYESWREEKRSAWLYRVIAECERGSTRQALFDELARAADTQAAIWLTALTEAGKPPPQDYRPDVRTRLVARLTRMATPRAMRGVLSAMKVRGMTLYAQAAPHATPTQVSEIGKRHQTGVSGNALRAGVFGVNDGLVSNAALIFGVAGAGQDPGAIVLTGVAGLLAGAFSMAAGEYVSVRAQREMFEYQIGLERDELEKYPQEEAAELALIYAAKGMPREDAERVATALMADPERALDTLAREELGLNPDELGSPWMAAGSSFAAFTIGAALPLLPFLLHSSQALPLSIGLTALGLFVVGASMSLFTGRHALFSGARMLAIGGTAGVATYLIGSWLGVTLA